MPDLFQPAVCALSVVPLRSGASDKDEMVSQLLFGELVDVLFQHKTKKYWVYVRCDWDDYEGWLDVRQLCFIAPDEVAMCRDNTAYVLDLVTTIASNNHFLPITMGAALPAYDGLNLHLADKYYTFSGQAIVHGQVPATTEWVIKLARRYLHAPYLWGGRSPFGIDCSGFTQIVYKMAGWRLPRDASQQVAHGRTVDFAELSQPADLAFFENEKGKIIHVGLVLEGNLIIHASGQVRVDRFDHFGIFNDSLKTYTHKLRIIRRLLPDMPPEIKAQMPPADFSIIDEGQMALF